VATTVNAAQPPTRQPVIERGVREVARSLSSLARTAEDLGRVADTAEATAPADLLATMAADAAAFNEHITELAPYARPPLADVAGDLADAAEALATRWDGLTPTRRHALIDTLLARRSELTTLLGGVDRAAPVAAEAPADKAPAVRPPRSSLGAKDAAKAWEAWTAEPSVAAAEVFMRLAQSWIEGTGAQLSRDERSPASASKATEVMDRVRHHLALLAAAGPISYMDALATARRRVIEELHTPERRRNDP
jgi:hypothetical protein